MVSFIDYYLSIYIRNGTIINSVIIKINKRIWRVNSTIIIKEKDKKKGDYGGDL